MKVNLDSQEYNTFLATTFAGKSKGMGFILKGYFSGLEAVDAGLYSTATSNYGAVNDPETFYPLHVYVCGECFLVQLEEFVSPEEIFREYAYFSSYSDSWLEHARSYVETLRLNEQPFAAGKSL